ncbi:hypothetical protein I7I51_08177 [Histoplasma capsulatum]|uniref:Uncharacterized protein n=1 Tax=Ajellomyces capsulatus TaxID=5037 RepID=A0A8A1LX60_AJECA|nr:hypothetical protein I7I51_08177 [Histoplasma capsulatum]
MGEYQKTVVALYWTYAQITFEVLKARAHSGQMGFVSWWHFDLEGVNAYRIKGMVMYRGNRGRRLNKYWRPMTSQKDSESKSIWSLRENTGGYPLDIFFPVCK